MSNNGYRLAPSGLLVKPETLNHPTTDEEAYLPANHALPTIPMDPVDIDDHDDESDQEPDVATDVQEQPSAVAGEPAGLVRRTWTDRQERLDAGETRRVRRERRGEAEDAHRERIRPKRVRQADRRNNRAAELERLAADPRAQAWSNRRSRFWIMAMAFTGISLGVLISSSSAQNTIATFMHWTEDMAVYYAAYFADPALGLILFASLATRNLASARGVPVPEVAQQALHRIELGLFALVALLNAGPAAAALVTDVVHLRWDSWGPDVMVLAIHTLGPVLVATGVFGVPYLALILQEISAATAARLARETTGTAAPVQRGTGGVTPAAYSANAPEPAGASDPLRVDEITAELRRLITSGQWRRGLSAKPIREHFGCGMDTAREVRDRLKDKAVAA